MLPFAYYLLKVMLCSGILFSYYWLALRNKKFHLYNRFYLLASVVLSWLIPLIKIDLFKEANQQTQIVKLLTAVAGGDQFVEEVASRSAFNWDWQLLPVSAFIAISALFFIKILITIVRITRLVRSHSVQKWREIYFVFTNAKGTPFSFFKYIFWNEEIDLKSPEGEHILKHELVHVQEKHSADKMFMNLVLIGGWYNPVMWLVCKELNILHEFIADEKAIKDGDAADFAAMLLKAAFPRYSFPLVNSFFYSPIKRRLLMLTTSKKISYSYLRRVAVLPLLSVTFVLFAFSFKKKNPYASPAATFRSFLKPKMDLKIEGTNEAAENFEDTTKNKKKGRSLTGSTDGSVKMAQVTLKDSTGQTVEIKADTIVVSKGKGKLRNELIILDGTITTWEDLKGMNPSDISTMTILKDQSAVEKYGEKGKNGVIEITTKAAVVQNNAQQKYVEEQKTTYQGFEKKYSGDQSKYKAFAKFIDTGITRAAQFPGGIQEWRRYLERNLNLNVLAEHKAPVGKYAVDISFNIKSDGSITKVTVETKPGYGTEDEAVRTIKRAPKWEPGKEDGVFADTQVKQTITFILTDAGALVTIDSIILI